jgi:hypothetical protein
MTDKKYVQFDLIAAEGESRKRVKGRVSVDERGIYIEFDKFGTVYDNIPVLIEQIDGVPRVIVWEDRKVEDPTLKVSLENARLR